MERKRIIIVGATGSIGRQTLEVIDSRPDLFEVVALSAHKNEASLQAAAVRYPGARLCLSGVAATSGPAHLYGPVGLDELIRGVEADIVVNGASGAGGLRVSLSALSSGKNLALANKESVVMAWPLLSEIAKSTGLKILPVDSEHAALFLLTEKIGMSQVDELIITASGGAFRNKNLSELEEVTPDEAAVHPNWSMGRKITIDSATMANKGLEVIEASRLFGLDAARVHVLVHPQSLVHALVRTKDGSLYAHISTPDMRLPIQNALTWPSCLPCPFGRLDLAGHTLDFRSPEAARYPLLGMAYGALAAGEGATIAYNAADEIAVSAFESGRIRYTDIARVVGKTLDKAWPSRAPDLESIFDIDVNARAKASEAVREIE